MSNAVAPPTGYHVDLPAGGKLVLKTQDEVDMWDATRDAYIKDYRLAKTNDLVLLGAILTQNLAMFRAQQRMNGMEPELDSADVPTGRYKQVPVKAADITGAQKQIVTASEEIRQLEKALGIDKKTREAGGAYNVADYIATLKRAAHSMSVHVTKRQKAYEAVMMEARWKIRLLRNGDPEDRQHHNISDANIVSWLEDELAQLEALDVKFANEVGKVFVGKL